MVDRRVGGGGRRGEVTVGRLYVAGCTCDFCKVPILLSWSLRMLSNFLTADFC